MNTGIRVTNVISYGPGDKLLLTYAFANGSAYQVPRFTLPCIVPTSFPVPGVPADKPKPSSKELNETIGKSVEGSIAVVRQMVKEGKL